MPTTFARALALALALRAGDARADPEPGYSLDDEWNAEWRRVLDRSGRPDPDGPIQQRFVDPLYPEYELDLAVPDFPLSAERAWAESEAGGRLWVQSLDEFELATRAQLKQRAPLGRQWKLAIAFDRLATRTVQSDLLRLDFAWDPPSGPFVTLSAYPRWEKSDSDLGAAVGYRHPAWGEARLRLFALDPFTNASYALAASRDSALDKRVEQVDLPIAVAGELVSRVWRGVRGELYAGGIPSQSIRVELAEPADSYHQAQSGHLAGGLVEWQLPDRPVSIGATALQVSTGWHREHDAEAELDRDVRERTRQLRAYLLAVPLESLRLEGQVRFTSRPEVDTGAERRDREWLTSARAEWMFSPVVGTDLGLLRLDREASGPPEVNVDGTRHRMVTRVILRLGALWASFGASWDLDPVGKGPFGGGGATLMFDL